MRVQIASEITHERRVQIERARTDNIKHTQKKKKTEKKEKRSSTERTEANEDSKLFIAVKSNFP